VGGLAPISTGVPSGRGGLLVSGTNAPLYTTSFSAALPNAKEETEKHEGRLAQALNLDRVTRVLEFRDPLASPLKPITISRPNGTKLESKTVWKGTEWVLGGPEHSNPKSSKPLTADCKC
jgi:meiosis-specific APC/C activator protein AMA1